MGWTTMETATQTSEEVKTMFLAELKDLLVKWDAEIEIADDNWNEDGSVRMKVEINGIYDEDGAVIREQCDIDLGRWIN